jgi:hypothetical protein
MNDAFLWMVAMPGQTREAVYELARSDLTFGWALYARAALSTVRRLLTASASVARAALVCMFVAAHV